MIPCPNTRITIPTRLARATDGQDPNLGLGGTHEGRGPIGAEARTNPTIPSAAISDPILKCTYS